MKHIRIIQLVSAFFVLAAGGVLLICFKQQMQATYHPAPYYITLFLVCFFLGFILSFPKLAAKKKIRFRPLFLLLFLALVCGAALIFYYLGYYTLSVPAALIMTAAAGCFAVDCFVVPEK